MAGIGAKFLIGPQVDIHDENATTGAFTPGGFSDPLNIGENGELTFELSEPDVSTRISTMPDATEGQALDTDLTGKPQGFTLKVDDVEAADGSLRIFAAAFSGEEDTVAQAAGSDVHVSRSIAAVGRHFFLGRRNISTGGAYHLRAAASLGGVLTGTATGGSSTTLTMTGAGWTSSALIGKKVMITGGTAAGVISGAISANTATEITATFSTAPAAGSTFVLVEPTALVADTDFSLNLTTGQFKALDSSNAIDAGDILEGIFDCLAITSKAIKGGTKLRIQFSLTGECKNKLTGARGHLFVPKVTAYASENVELASGDFQTTTLKGTPEIPSRALLEALGWDSLVNADADSLWGDLDSPTTLYVFIPSETRAAA